MKEKASFAGQGLECSNSSARGVVDNVLEFDVPVLPLHRLDIGEGDFPGAIIIMSDNDPRGISLMMWWGANGRLEQVVPQHNLSPGG
jgi:hypothetical protein